MLTSTFTIIGAAKCQACGEGNAADAHFCGACGFSLRARCACGAPFRARQKYCSRCGEPLPAANARASANAGEAENRQTVNGERKIATVLVADIASSTELTKDSDAEEQKEILEPILNLMSDVVWQFDGHVERRQGDGIVASFGARPADEDHAVKACYAGLKIQEEMQKQATDMRRRGMFLQARVGINSGSVVVAETELHGMVNNIAHRLEKIAAPGGVVLTADTLQLAKGLVRVSEIGPVQLRGLDQPVNVWELNGINRGARIQALAARGLSKFVGRDAEMDLLRRAAEKAALGRGQVVALVGEAGVGKSRLFLEFTRSPSLERWLVLEAASVSYGKATSYLPLLDLLGRYFEIHARDDERRVREKVAGKLFALNEEKLFQRLPLFVGALVRGGTEPTWANLTPAERQSQLFAAAKELLIRESQQRPLCLVFEDLHWVDAETQAFLDVLLESIPAARLLLLVNFRPDYDSRWTKKTYYLQTRVDPLREGSAEELLDALLGPDPQLDTIKRELITATDGNPLFLEESVRKLIEDGIVTGGPGDWRLLRRLPPGFVPPTIQGLLAARIDRLQPGVKQILRCAAVIGNDVPQALLEAVTGLSSEELDRGIRELQSAEFLYEKTLFPEVEYTFKHSMTREVAYESLVREEKAALHARAAHALVELGRDRPEEHVERIAEHSERGRLWEMAVQYLERAGAKSYSLYANPEAAKFFERALQVLGRLPDTTTSKEQSVDIRFELRNALLATGETDRIGQLLEEMEPVVSALQDSVRSARYAAYRSNHYFLAGEQRRSIEFGTIGLGLARESGERRMEGEMLYRLGQSYYALGEYRKAMEFLERSLVFTSEKFERSRFDLTVIPGVVSRTWLAIALNDLGDLGFAMSHAKRALEIAEECEHPLSQVLGWLAIGCLLLRKGENEGAIAALERAMNLCDEWSLRVWRPRVASSLAVAYGRARRLDEGVALAREAVADGERMRLTVDKPLLLVRLGQACLMAAKIEEALSLGSTAVELAHSREAKGDEAWARFLLGRAHWASDPPLLDASQAEVEKALDLAIQCEAKPLVAFCNTTLGVIHNRRGDDVTAGALSAAADAVYQELGMRPLPVDPVH